MYSELPVLAPTSRFSNRAENYVRYRPGYPPAIVPFLERTLALNPQSRIADIGSGTGLFAEPLLQRGYSVVCIEPNEEMRKFGEKKLSQYGGFISRRHKAEATGLRGETIDLITVAQAFHWLDLEAARKEFDRILKPGGCVLLAWNVRGTNTYFLQEYAVLRERYNIEGKIESGVDEARIAGFFGAKGFEQASFPNVQMLDFDALKGQLLSSSYMPLPGHPQYETMISALVQLFVACNENGFVRMEFETRLFWGQ